jgi:hypothetical protein
MAFEKRKFQKPESFSADIHRLAKTPFRPILRLRFQALGRFSPMNKTLQVVLTALALAGTFCAINNGRMTASDGNNPNSVKAVLYADGTDPMPACRNRVCPPANN